jgi:Flp pilus assembly protein TadG
MSGVPARIWRNNDGLTFLELTLVAPVLISLALGVSEFGRALQHHHVINKSVRDAARYLSRVPAVCPAGTIAATDVTTAKNLALTGYSSGGTPILSYWTDPLTITAAVTCFDNSAGTYRGVGFIPIVTVTATVPYTGLGLLAPLGFGTITFTAAHQEVVIGE